MSNPKLEPLSTTVAPPPGKLDSSPAPAAQRAQQQHPLRAPLVLRVGVTGHRPDSSKRSEPAVETLREISRELLLQIQDTFARVRHTHIGIYADLPPRADGKPPGLRLVSALAEGADQWVAADAYQLGYELQAVLPFARHEYERDFADRVVLKEHRRLRDHATAVFELDGCRAQEGESYLAAGRVLLNQSDLLIALWDGKESQGTGGTAQVVQEALLRGIPTLWVDWQASANDQPPLSAWRLLQQPGDIKDPAPPKKNPQGEIAALKTKVRELLLPPGESQPDRRTERDLREKYFKDRRHAWTLLGGWWNLFRNFLCLELRRLKRPLKIRIPEFISDTKAEWKDEWEKDHAGQPLQHRLPDAVIKQVEAGYLPHYAWADKLSNYYANHYRSSFVWIYLLGALAVLLALIGTTAHVSEHVEGIFIAAEVVTIGVILGLTWFGWRLKWHEKWIDYRILAERLRMARFNGLLGGVWQQVNVPLHLATYGNPATTWMHWHARAVERAAGLLNVTVDAAYLAACRELLLEALIVGQANYHKDTAHRLEKVDHRLHRFGAVLFMVTFLVCAFHLLVATPKFYFAEMAKPLNPWLIFGAAFLPALGGAMAAIRSQGEFHRVVQRSRAMHEKLDQLRQAVAAAPVKGDQLNSQALQQAVEQTTRLMYNEVLDWRIVFHDRPLDLPG